jgi:hypothetical protein
MEIAKQRRDDRRREKWSSIVIDWYKVYCEEGLPRKEAIEQDKMMAWEPVQASKPQESMAESPLRNSLPRIGVVHMIDEEAEVCIGRVTLFVHTFPYHQAGH